MISIVQEQSSKADLVRQYKKNLLNKSSEQRDGSLTRKLFNDLAKASNGKKSISFTL